MHLGAMRTCGEKQKYTQKGGDMKSRVLRKCFYAVSIGLSGLVLILAATRVHAQTSHSYVNDLWIQNFQVIDISGPAEALAGDYVVGHKYKVITVVKNMNQNDTKWYDNISLRIVPKQACTQFYRDSELAMPISRYDSVLFKLKSKEQRTFTFFMRYSCTGYSYNQVLYNTGIYAQEIVIQNTWRKLNRVGQTP
jgi:hypothetical protein